MSTSRALRGFFYSFVVVDGMSLPIGMHQTPAILAESWLAEARHPTVGVRRAGPGRSKQKPTPIISDHVYV